MRPDRLSTVRLFAILAGCSLTIAACSNSATTDSAPTSSVPTSSIGEDLWPDVVGATASQHEDGSWTISATLSSAYDSPERYADAWRVRLSDGRELGVRELSHDHAGEQPFTRSLSDVEIPDDVTMVIIQGRDQRSGWGGETFSLLLDR